MTCDLDLCNCITLANARPCLYLVSYFFPINLVYEATVNNKCWKDKKILLKLSQLKSSFRFFLKRQGRKLLVHLYLTQNPHNGAGNIHMLGKNIEAASEQNQGCLRGRGLGECPSHSVILIHSWLISTSMYVTKEEFVPLTTWFFHPKTCIEHYFGQSNGEDSNLKENER